MKHPRLLRGRHAWISFCCMTGSLALPLAAQTTPVSSTASTTEDEETLVLSPFIVSTADDQGYIATNTLAGSRLNTSLRDTPASISVMTKAFLDDIGALDVTAAVEFGLNAGNDIGGGSAGVGATTGNGLIGNDFNIQIRNFRNATQTRDYFDSLIGGDVFNVDRIDISRGPNSLLFGIGSVGGVVNVSSKRPNLSRNQLELQLRTGSYSRNRAALDVNQVLIKDKLAVRGNLMKQATDGYHDFESNDQERGAFAITWNPWKSTTVRVNGELGRMHQVKVRPWLPWDNVNQWEFFGSTTVPYGTPESPWVLGDTNYSQQQRSNGSGAPNNNLPAKFPNDPYFGTENLTAGNIVAGTQYAAFMDGPLAGKVLYLGTRAQGARYYRTSSGRNVQNFNSPDTFDDESVFPRTGNMLGSGNYLDTDYETFGAAIEHKIGRNLFFELAANTARVKKDNRSLTGFANIAVLIDTTTTLPVFKADGTYDATLVANATQAAATGKGVGTLTFNSTTPANPYVGGLMFVSTPTFSLTDQTQEDVRASVNYNLEAGRWGDHKLLAFASRAKSTRDAQSYAEANVHPNRINVNFFANVPIRVYHYDPFSANLAERGAPSPWDNPIPTGPVFANPTENFQSAFVRRDWTKSESVIDSTAIAAQSAYFDGSLVTTLGLRRDRIRTYTSTRTQTPANTQEVIDAVLADVPGLDQSGNSHSIGAVYHLPFKALQGISVFANRSTNFRDQANASFFRDATEQQVPIGPLEGVGLDYGFKFSLFSGKVNATVTRYETSFQKQTFGHQGNVASYITAIWNAIENNGPVTTNPTTRVVSGSDVRDATASGYELEITANLKPNWRLSFNVGQAENRLANAGSALQGYLERHMAEWSSHSGLSYNTATAPGFLNNSGGSNTVGALIVGLNDWLTFVQAQNGQIETNLRPWNGNAYTAYDFREGTLKGLTIGGGINYRGKQVLGVIPAVAATGSTPFVPSEILMGRGYYLGNAMVAYKFQLKNKVNVRLQLNVQNLFDNSDKQILASNWNPLLNNGAGDLQTFEHYFEPRTYSLSATFSY